MHLFFGVCRLALLFLFLAFHSFDVLGELAQRSFKNLFDFAYLALTFLLIVDLSVVPFHHFYELICVVVRNDDIADFLFRQQLLLLHVGVLLLIGE